MSVDCHLYLPVDVTARDLEVAIPILLGAEKFDDTSLGFHVTLVGVRKGDDGWKAFAKESGIESMSTFDWGKLKMPLAPAGLWPTFHYIARRGNKVYNMLHLSSSPTRIALAIRLAEFFGGIVDYNDCDEDGKELRFRRSRAVPNMLADMEDEDYGRFQRALMALEPLTKKEIRAARKFAAYKEE